MISKTFNLEISYLIHDFNEPNMITKVGTCMDNKKRYANAIETEVKKKTFRNLVDSNRLIKITKP